MPTFKLLRSPSNNDNTKNIKSRIYINLFYFAAGDTNTNSGLEVEYMIDTGATCSIINHPTFIAIANLGHKLIVTRTNTKIRTYTGSLIRMLGYVVLTSSYDLDNKHIFQHKVWITEEDKSNLLGIDFCNEHCKGLNFDIPALELKDLPGKMCHGTSFNEKAYPNVSQIEKIITPHSLTIDAKTSRLDKHQHMDPNKFFPIGTTFVSHRDLVKTCFQIINVICTQSEKALPT